MKPGFITHYPYDRASHALACQTIGDMGDSTTYAQFAFDVQWLLTPGDTLLWLAADGKRTNTGMVKSGDDLIIFLCGIPNKDYVPGILEGYQRFTAGHWQIGETAGMDDALDSIWAAAGPGWLSPAKRISIYGHSWGGAIGTALGVFLQRQLNKEPLRVYTYGSPRPGNEYFAEQANAMDVKRFMLSGDAVTRTPPWYTEFPAVSLIGGYGEMRKFSTWRQPTRGFQIDVPGTFWLATEEVPVTNSQAATSLLNLLYGWFDNANVVHRISSYRASFAAGAVGSTPPAEAPQPEPEKPPKLNSTVRTRIETEGERILRATVRQPNNIFENTVVTPIDPNLPDRYRRKRFGDMWAVVFRDDIVDCASGKRHAKQLARRYNLLAQAKATIEQGI